MNSEPFDNILGALLWMKTGLCGAVAPSLRAVTVDLDIEDQIYMCHFFYDGPIDDELFDLASVAAAEASDCWFCDAKYTQLDFPAPIPVDGALAYLRKEPGIVPPKVQLLPRSPRMIDCAYLAYAMQQALLGRVLPSLRYVIIDVDEEKKILCFYFYYDKEITEELLLLSKETISIAKKAFSDSFTSVEEIVFFPFPKRIPSDEGWGVYKRYEKYDDEDS
jgi:hypothetical protein